ncbi:MAG: hypothetical protein GWN30_09440, partial [Gammaproteobacteria bacterium]|nr:hypothetical protein [Gammaproteobacteria bacterium]NIW98227.1 hypothetical protein [Phycisphaerae bacterium]
REVTFVHNGRDLHLSECSVADDSLRGIGLTEVTTDFDGELRDPVAPFMGADEAEGEVPQVFAPPLNFASGQQSFLMTGGDLDADGDIDLAVTNSQPNNGSNDVSLL